WSMSRRRSAASIAISAATGAARRQRSRRVRAMVVARKPRTVVTSAIARSPRRTFRPGSRPHAGSQWDNDLDWMHRIDVKAIQPRCGQAGEDGIWWQIGAPGEQQLPGVLA